MDQFLDSIWFTIVKLVGYIVKFLDLITSPLDKLGPLLAISFLTLLTYIITKYLSRFKTKRYKRLQKEFVYWYNLRNEALKCNDPEKGKALAKNIDQAELNKVYYDYFFEGLLNSLITKYLPLLSMLAYVNEKYKPENLLKLFGRNYVFKFNYFGKPILVGSVAWFILSLIIIYIIFFMVKLVLKKYGILKTKKIVA